MFRIRSLIKIFVYSTIKIFTVCLIYISHIAQNFLQAIYIIVQKDSKGSCAIQDGHKGDVIWVLCVIGMMSGCLTKKIGVTEFDHKVQIYAEHSSSTSLSQYLGPGQAPGHTYSLPIVSIYLFQFSHCFAFEVYVAYW